MPLSSAIPSYGDFSAAPQREHIGVSIISCPFSAMELWFIITVHLPSIPQEIRPRLLEQMQSTYQCWESAAFRLFSMEFRSVSRNLSPKIFMRLRIEITILSGEDQNKYKNVKNDVSNGWVNNEQQQTRKLCLTPSMLCITM